MISEEEINNMFQMGFDCSQIVLSEVSEKLGMSKEEARKVAACFGIGMAQGSICGAATGAMMAIGLRYGNYEPFQMDKKGKVFEVRDEFMRRFEQMNGKVICPEMLGKRIDTLNDLMTTFPTGLYKNCPRYCYNAILILNDLL